MAKIKLKLKKPDLSSAKLYAERLRREKLPSAMNYEKAVKELPRITNDTVAEHREEVLSGARKFIYPLQHSRRRVLTISLSIFLLIVVSFTAYVMLALYSFRSTSAFIYRVTQVVPFPVAKVGHDYVSYESYLFELRHYMHYYETQQKVDFDDDSGKAQLETYRKQALDQVVEFKYVDQLAHKHQIEVDDSEVNQAIELLKVQNRLGNGDQVLRGVLKDYWGWSIDDFKRELRQQLLAQKVARVLDVEANQKADKVVAELKSGQNFEKLAKEYSDDTSSKDNGGLYDGLIDTSSRDVPPQIIQALAKLKPGQTSSVIATGTNLEVVKLISVNDGKYKAAHITIELKPLSSFLEPIKKDIKPVYYIGR